ncbi:hypothetical protein HOD38_03875 [archaeon]|nr:hypothetical protein [archaeon]MBT4397380.1 hypothetical protein [archaeon]MBT4440760.1 hypothetical protein [archaeon]
MNKMGDYYLEDPSRLEGQPKRVVADYVESNGILIPRRFDSLAEARRSRRGVFLRSEHEQDYAGVSGLGDSFSLSYFSYRDGSPYRGVRSIDEAVEIYFRIEDQHIKEDDGDTWGKYVEFCELQGIPLDEFKAQFSFSLWEHLGGYNRAVVADSSVPNRWHIFTDDKRNHTILNYSIYDEKLGLRDLSPRMWKLTTELDEGVTSLIREYEKVRHLGRFDANHCPIIEFQTIGQKNYFLQYFRTRDFKPANFVLDREPEEGEVEISFVRGATETSEGEVFHTLWSGAGKKDLTNVPDSLLHMFGRSYLGKLTLHKTKLQALDNMGGLWGLLQGVANGHDGRMLVFSPELFIGLVGDEYAKITPDDFSYLLKRDQYLDLHVVSDGRRAFVKRL